MNFRVGQKVICVDVKPVRGNQWFDGAPTKGAIYTVRAKCVIDGIDCVLLNEIARKSGKPYGAFRFRPIVERKTDISVFTKMLKRKPAHAGGD